MKTINNNRWAGDRRRAALAVLTAAALALGMTPAAHAQESAPTVAPAASATTGTVTDAALEWGYSKYAQVGVFGAWAQGATGDNTTIVHRNGQEVTGDAAEASIDYSLVTFTGGVGSIDPVTGAGDITWPGDGVWSVNAVPMFGAPDVYYTEPVLEVDEDRSGSLSFLVSTADGSDQSGNPVPGQPQQRVVVQTFSDVTLDDGRLTTVPDYTGVPYLDAGGNNLVVAGGGAWPQTYIDFLPEAVRAFHYQTSMSGLNLKKAPLPIVVDTQLGDTDPGDPDPQPQISLFAADGTTPLANTQVQPGETIVVKGSGFDPQANNPGGNGSGLPIPNNQPQGTFVAFGQVTDPWQPSVGAPAENRAQVRANTKWVLLDEVVDALAEPLRSTIRQQAVSLQPDGTFTAEIKAEQPAETNPAGAYGIYTYAGGAAGLANPAQELFTPVNFAATDDGEDPDGPTVGDGELVWGFKQGWRDYVTGIAAGTIYAGAHTTVDESGLYHYTQSDESTYDPATGEGIVKYEGRVRFTSSEHGFDIVLDNPWVTFTESGTRAVLSAGVSQSATVGDLSVVRIDLADLTVTAPERRQEGDNAVYTWSDVAGTFRDTLQPAEWQAFYAGQATDPLSFSVTLAESGDDNGGDEGSASGVWTALVNLFHGIFSSFQEFFAAIARTFGLPVSS